MEQQPRKKSEQLKILKALNARSTLSYNIKLTERQATCQDCRRQCSIDRLILDHIKEVSLLFPERQVTTANIHDWLNGDITIRRVRTYLKDNPISKGRSEGKRQSR